VNVIRFLVSTSTISCAGAVSKMFAVLKGTLCDFSKNYIFFRRAPLHWSLFQPASCLELIKTLHLKRHNYCHVIRSGLARLCWALERCRHKTSNQQSMVRYSNILMCIKRKRAHSR